MSTNSIYFFSVPMERFELSIVRVLKPLRMPIPPHRYLGWMMGIEPTHNAPQAFALPLGYIQHMQFHKDLNPNFFIRSERCYPLHHRTIFAPPERFELSSAVLETDMLPLHQRDVCWNRKTRTFNPRRIRAVR